MIVTLGGALGTIVTKQSNNQRDRDGDATLSRYLKMFNDSWNYAKSNYHKRWENNWKLYNGIRVKRSHDGVVETFVPLVNSSVNTIVASLFNSNPAVNYIPNHPEQEADTAVLNEIYADFARRDGWVQKNKVNGRQGIITGNFCTYYEWVADKTGGYVHKVNVPVRDMIIDPRSHGYEDWRYVGRRFFASKSVLEQETIYDIEKGERVKRYSNLDAVSSKNNSNEYESDKQAKDQVVGNVIDGDGDTVELIEIWTRKEVVVIANRTTLIEQRENPHYTLEKSQFEQRKIAHDIERTETLRDTGVDIGEFDEEFNESEAGLLPFAHGRNYEDISLPYGTSDVDIIADEQELLNDITEISVEASLYTVYPEMQIDPKYSSIIDECEHTPGKVYPIAQGAISWLNPPQIPQNLLGERTNLKDEMREAISVSQISKGVAATDSITATEIKATLGRGDIRIQEKAQTLANDFFFQEAKIVLKLVQLYASEKMFIHTTKDAKVSLKEINPTKFLGEYTPMVTLDVQRKLEETEARESYMQAYQMLIADPTNNLEAVKRHCLPKILTDLTPEQINEIITPQTQNIQGAVENTASILPPQEQVQEPEQYQITI